MKISFSELTNLQFSVDYNFVPVFIMNVQTVRKLLQTDKFVQNKLISEATITHFFLACRIMVLMQIFFLEFIF